MRLSFTGAAGIGKTTLAKTLAAELVITFIAEDFHEVVRAFNRAHPLETKSEQIVRCRESCLRWLKKRELLYSSNPDFVEDRCAIDILFRWLIMNVSDNNNSETTHIIGLTKKLLGQVDGLVILPLTVTTEPENHDGLVRAGSINRLFRAQSLAIGIAQQLVAPSKIIMVPELCDTIEARRAFVLQKITV